MFKLSAPDTCRTARIAPSDRNRRSIPPNNGISYPKPQPSQAKTRLWPQPFHLRDSGILSCSLQQQLPRRMQKRTIAPMSFRRTGKPRREYHFPLGHALIKTTRSQYLAVNGSWVTITIVLLRSLLKLAKQSITTLEDLESKFPYGSSANIRSGPFIRYV